MAELTPDEYAKRLILFEKQQEKTKEAFARLDNEISEIEKAIENNQNELAEKNKKRADLEKLAAVKLIPEQQKLREAALSSIQNLFMYKAFCIDSGKTEEIYNNLVNKYKMLKEFLKPNSWLVIEESGADQKITSNQKTSFANDIEYGYVAIGKTMDPPLNITRKLEGDGELYMQIRLRFKPEGFVFRTYGPKKDGSGMGIRVDLVETPNRSEFGKSEDSIYWHLFHPVLSRLEERGSMISYVPSSLTDPIERLDFYHGDERLKKMGLDPSVKTVKELYQQLNL